MKKSTSIIIVSLISFLVIFFGVDFWTGKSTVYDGTIYDTYVNYYTNNGVRTSNCYAEVTTDEDMGMPIKVSISIEQYRNFEKGQSVKLEMSRGGITGFNYDSRVR